MGHSAGRSPHDSPREPIADVEVSELTLDEEEFSSTYGGITTRFDALELEPIDPWGTRRRND
jgi:hypothetical protein